MLFKKIQKTLELNRIKIEFSGKKIYYDKMTLWLSLTISTIMIVLSIVFYIIADKWEWLFIIPIALLFVPEKIRKLFFRNPVFIFQKDRFYYTQENCWFDKTNCEVRRKTNIGTSISDEFVINDTKHYIEIEEDIFFLDDANDFRKEIKQYIDNTP